jgi:type IV pilus assembly protein PilA
LSAWWCHAVPAGVRYHPVLDDEPMALAMRRGGNGFSVTGILVALAIVAILATLAVPNFLNRNVREQIVEALPLADIAKKPIAIAWAGLQAFPADNASAGLPAADKIVNNYIKSVAVEDGTIQITFGNNAHGALTGKILTLRPAVVEDAPVVPVAWVCGYAAVPDNMSVKGANKTNIPTAQLPFSCRESPKQGN